MPEHRPRAPEDPPSWHPAAHHQEQHPNSGLLWPLDAELPPGRGPQKQPQLSPVQQACLLGHSLSQEPEDKRMLTRGECISYWDMRGSPGSISSPWFSRHLLVGWPGVEEKHSDTHETNVSPWSPQGRCEKAEGPKREGCPLRVSEESPRLSHVCL